MGFKLKICGMKYAANIVKVAELQPNYLGFIFYDQSPRFMSEVSSELIKYIPPSIKTTGVFVNAEADIVKAHMMKHNLKAVQLHGSENVTYCKELKVTGTEIIKAFGVDENFDFDQLEAYSNVVDYFLFDTQTPLHGGSGKVFDWKLLNSYKLQKPYFLSGGIDLNNITEIRSIKDPRLYAIDINSKFEVEPGLKDVEKLEEFIKELSS